MFKLSIALTALLAVSCAGTDETKPAASAMPEMGEEEMMAKMMEYATPGAPHADLQKLVGDWSVKGTNHFGPEPEAFTASSTFTSLLGGRFVQEDYRGDFMGQPFNGLLIQGYDNFQQQYMSVWMDSMGTYMMTMTGKRNADGDIVMQGDVHDFMTPDGRIFQVTIHDVSDDEFRLTFHEQQGEEMPMIMESVYTRS